MRDRTVLGHDASEKSKSIGHGTRRLSLTLPTITSGHRRTEDNEWILYF